MPVNTPTTSPDVSHLPVVRPNKILTLAPVANMMVKGYSQRQIAEVFSVSTQAVKQFVRRNRDKLHALTDHDNMMSAKLKILTHEIADAVTGTDIKKASLANKVICLGTIIDKVRLIDGQSTANISVNQQLTQINELSNQIKELESMLTVNNLTEGELIDREIPNTPDSDTPDNQNNIDISGS